MKVVWGAVCEELREFELFLTGDSKWPRKLEREKSLTSLFNHWVSDCWRRREGDEGGEGGVLERVGKPEASPIKQPPPPPPIPPAPPPPLSPKPCPPPTPIQPSVTAVVVPRRDV